MNEEIIDLDEFLERVQDDKELLCELLDIFMEDFGGKRKALEEAFGKNDLEEVRNIAHSLKGASGNISAKPLRQIFLELEDAAKNSNLTDTNGCLKQIDEQYNLLVSRIESLKKELTA
ncbi:MAG: Hpt domain-containing protein [Candidatus Omnitrophica bacterium]|nr:Hpt domain-containing protein [Candidatus Omnitrophota bacterium]MCB9747637.1 Hpt domain-containing protein [Candidatus Omnitrophota bacterium]